MILIVAEESDLHARYVQRIINAGGRCAEILDPSRLGENCLFSHEPERGAHISRSGLAAINFSEVRTVWVRRPSMAEVPGAVVDVTARQFIRHEWSEALNGMVLGLARVRWVNHPVWQAVASKPAQLEAARRLGLAVPDTLITNDKQRALAFVKRHDGLVVHKALSAPNQRLIDTRMWSQTDTIHVEQSLGLAPTMFQEWIEGDTNIRTVVTGREVFSVAIRSAGERAPVDSRADPNAQYAVHSLPSDVEESLIDLLRRLGLVFGVIDMKIDPLGSYVFLEVNPQGQFLFMEIRTGLPIGAGVARFLEDDEQ